MKGKAGNWMTCYGKACYGKAVPEPPLENEMCFQLPRTLENNNKIEISGKIKPNPEWIFLNLSATRFPGKDKFICKLEVNFSSEKIIFRIKENGKTKTYEAHKRPSDLLPDSKFKFTIKVRMEGSTTLDMYIGESYAESWNVMQNLKDIQFLTLSNDIDKVEELKFRYINEPTHSRC